MEDEWAVGPTSLPLGVFIKKQVHIQAKAWGDPKKPKPSMAYLLIVLAQAVQEERTFGLVAI